MHLLITLLLAHLIADFPLQTNGLAKLKRECLTGVFLHVLVYVVITASIIQDWLTYWPLIVGLGVVHFVIDALKLRLPKTVETFYFIIDQALHYLSIAIATVIALSVWAVPPSSIVPYPVAIVALSGAFVLAIMVFCWVWVNSLHEEQIYNNRLLRWVKDQLLALEQRLGLVLVGLVFAGPTNQWLVTIFHLSTK